MKKVFLILGAIILIGGGGYYYEGIRQPDVFGRAIVKLFADTQIKFQAMGQAAEADKNLDEFAKAKKVLALQKEFFPDIRTALSGMRPPFFDSELRQLHKDLLWFSQSMLDKVFVAEQQLAFIEKVSALQKAMKFDQTPLAKQGTTVRDAQTLLLQVKGDAVRIGNNLFGTAPSFPLDGTPTFGEVKTMWQGVDDAFDAVITFFNSQNPTRTLQSFQESNFTPVARAGVEKLENFSRMIDNFSSNVGNSFRPSRLFSDDNEEAKIVNQRSNATIQKLKEKYE